MNHIVSHFLILRAAAGTWGALCAIVVLAWGYALASLRTRWLACWAAIERLVWRSYAAYVVLVIFLCIPVIVFSKLIEAARASAEIAKELTHGFWYERIRR